MIKSLQAFGWPSLHIGSHRVKAIRAFTLIELLVVVVIIGIMSSLVISFSLSILRRERVNALALSFAGWIEEVRNLSARRVGSGMATEGCAITFSAAGSAAVAGDQLAIVSPAGAAADTCAPRDGGLASRDGKFVIPSDLEGTFSFKVVRTGTSTTVSNLIFTPRGTVGLAADSSGLITSSGEFTIKLLLNGKGPMRCLRVSETLAVVDLAPVNTTSIDADCGTSYSAI
jgi:prepilin-type N-terminal cleavage/methylation domain-containing protein